MTGPLPGTIPERPFGVHFRMAPWKSLVVLIAIPVLLLVVQVIVFQAVVLIEQTTNANAGTELALVGAA